ncbi:hypothetical protein [Amycolatopsis sp. NPDC004079]|uniref:Restriction endonuclease domain-containing protein n=1 Tax=Amycolatopsis halotolerans TaxID=330083 RepID=A0ABV7QI04_9PSEU
MKLFEYADAGIEHYWIVDLDPPVSMIAYRLIDGDYENFGEYSASVELEVEPNADPEHLPEHHASPLRQD